MKQKRSNPLSLLRPKSATRTAGRPRAPRSTAEAALQNIDAAIRAPRRLLTARVRSFIAHYVESDQRDAISSASAVGYTRPAIGTALSLKYRDLIAAEALRRKIGRQMELDEALQLLAGVARDENDRKTQHSALRTILEVHGALSGGKLPPGERSGIERQIEEMVGRLKQKLDSSSSSGANRVSIRAGVEISVDSGVGAASTIAGIPAVEGEITADEGVLVVQTIKESV